jgi:hypothetical protein
MEEEASPVDVRSVRRQLQRAVEELQAIDQLRQEANQKVRQLSTLYNTAAHLYGLPDDLAAEDAANGTPTRVLDKPSIVLRNGRVVEPKSMRAVRVRDLVPGPESEPERPQTLASVSRTRDAIAQTLKQRPGHSWSVEEIQTEMMKQGWEPTSDTPDAVIRTSLSRLARDRSSSISRDPSRRGHYIASADQAVKVSSSEKLQLEGKEASTTSDS